MTIVTERDQIVTKVADETKGHYTVTQVDTQQSSVEEPVGKKSESYSDFAEQDDITMAAISQKNDNTLLATLISVGAYVLLNLMLFVFSFFWPSTFQSMVFKGWPHLSENSAFLYSYSSVWFALTLIAAALVFVGFYKKNARLLIPYLVLASAEFVQLTLYGGTFFAFALVGGLFQDKNYFGMESTVAYVFSILGIGILMIAFSVAYFFAFIGIALEAKKIIEFRFDNRKRIHYV